MINPRESKHLGTMISIYRRWQLGDVHTYQSPEDVIKNLYPIIYGDETELPLSVLDQKLRESNQAAVRPLYVDDHSNVRIATTPFPNSSHSRQIGFIYATQSDIEKEFGAFDTETLGKARGMLEAEVQAYDLYLREHCNIVFINEEFYCSRCGRNIIIRFTEDEYAKLKSYKQGEGLIQDMLPEHTPAERELIRGGACGECWIEMFGHR